MLPEVDHQRSDGRSHAQRQSRVSLGVAAVPPGGFALRGLWGRMPPRAEMRAASEPAGANVVAGRWFRGNRPFSENLPPVAHGAGIRAAGRQEETTGVSSGQEPQQIQPRRKRRQAFWLARFSHHLAGRSGEKGGLAGSQR